MDFLPITQQEMLDRGWQQCDFVYVIGDAYVDHPSFGHAIISRVLEHHGYSVGIISQPDWKNPKSITTFGRPRLGFLVTGGNMDSMVNHYSVTKHRRKTDAFTPGKQLGMADPTALHPVNELSDYLLLSDNLFELHNLDDAVDRRKNKSFSQTHYLRPVEPNPPAPRSVSLSCSTHSHSMRVN